MIGTSETWTKRGEVSARACLGAAAALMAAGAVAARADDGPGLAPHRAVYEITLAKSNSGSGVSELTGRMVYELAGSSCEGWTQNMRFVTRSSNQEGAAQIKIG